MAGKVRCRACGNREKDCTLYKLTRGRVGRPLIARPSLQGIDLDHGGDRSRHDEAIKEYPDDLGPARAALPRTPHRWGLIARCERAGRSLLPAAQAKMLGDLLA